MRESGAWGPVLRVRWSSLSQGRAELRGELGRRQSCSSQGARAGELERGWWWRGCWSGGRRWSRSSPRVGWGALEPEHPGLGGVYTGEEQEGLGEEYPTAAGLRSLDWHPGQRAGRVPPQSVLG